jgi:hypothetical protein
MLAQFAIHRRVITEFNDRHPDAQPLHAGTVAAAAAGFAFDRVPGLLPRTELSALVRGAVAEWDANRPQEDAFDADAMLAREAAAAAAAAGSSSMSQRSGKDSKKKKKNDKDKPKDQDERSSSAAGPPSGRESALSTDSHGQDKKKKK